MHLESRQMVKVESQFIPPNRAFFLSMTTASILNRFQSGLHHRSNFFIYFLNMYSNCAAVAWSRHTLMASAFQSNMHAGWVDWHFPNAVVTCKHAAAGTQLWAVDRVFIYPSTDGASSVMVIGCTCSLGLLAHTLVWGDIVRGWCRHTSPPRGGFYQATQVWV